MSARVEPRCRSHASLMAVVAGDGLYEGGGPAVRPRPACAAYFAKLLENVPDKRETSVALAKDASGRGKRILDQAA